MTRSIETVDLSVAQALRSLSLLSASELETIATQALVRGDDSPALRKLAGGAETTLEAEGIFDKAMAELGRSHVEPQEVALRYATWISEGITLGEIAPYDGAKMIWRATIGIGQPTLAELQPFVYAASEYENRVEDREFFAHAIRQHAVDLLDKAQPGS